MSQCDYSAQLQCGEGTLVVQNNSALGSSVGGTIVTNGGTLDLGGTLAAQALNLNAEVVTASGSGANGRYYARQGANNKNFWADPITLNGRAIIDANSGYYSTLSGVISGTGSVVKIGLGTIYVSNTNNLYTGTTTITNGTLWATVPGALPGYATTGRVTLAYNGNLTVSSGLDGTNGWTSGQINTLIAAATFSNDSAQVTIDTTYASVPGLANIQKGFGLNVQGTNIVTLSGVNSNSTALTNNGYIRLYNGARLFVGNNAVASGSVIQNDGLVEVATNTGSTSVFKIGLTGGYGYYRLNGGTLRAGRIALCDGGTQSQGVMDIYGGSAAATVDYIVFGQTSGSGVINLFGGTLIAPPGTDVTFANSGNHNNFGMLNMLGSGAFFDATGGRTDRSINLANASGNRDQVFNLNAGTNVIGTLSLVASTTLSGTLLVDVAADGTSDLLAATGNLDLSSLALQVANTAGLNKQKVYTIITCSGNRTGTFSSTNLPDSRWHPSYSSDGSVKLHFVDGTLLELR